MNKDKQFGANANNNVLLLLSVQAKVSVFYLDGDSERGGAKVPLHQVGHPLSGAE